MNIKNWTVGKLVAYLTGNQLYKEIDFYLPTSLRVIKGEFEIQRRKIPKLYVKDYETESEGEE